MAENSPKYTMATLRPILQELDLISEEDIERITDSTEKTRESWRRHHKGFPCVRIGNKYFYPIGLAKKYVQNLVAEKHGDELAQEEFL